MAGTKVSALPAATVLADADLLPIVDVSDTTQAPTGTTKAMEASTVAEYTVATKIPEALATLTMDGVTDQTTAFSAELNALDNGRVFKLRQGQLLITDEVVVPRGVDLVAGGTSGQRGAFTEPGTDIICQGDGRLVFMGGGSMSGGFRLIGDSNTGPLMICGGAGGNECNERLFQSITLLDSATDALLLRGCQNNVFVNMFIENVDGNAITLDARSADGLGAAGNRFYGLEITGVSGWHVVNEDTVATSAAPNNNAIFGGILERSLAGTLEGFVKVTAGSIDLYQVTMAMEAGGDVTTAGISLAGATSAIRLYGTCNLIARSGETQPAVLQTGGTLGLHGRLGIQQFAIGFQFNGGSQDILGAIGYTSVTTRVAFGGGSAASSRAPFVRPLQVVGLEGSTDTRVLEAFRVGESFARLHLAPNFLAFGDGTAAPAQYAEIIKPTTVTTSAALSPNGAAASTGQVTMQTVTALTVGLTVNAPSGTAVDGTRIIFRIRDNGTTRTITWNAIYTSLGPTLPANTTPNKWHYVEVRYNAADTEWQCHLATVEP